MNIKTQNDAARASWMLLAYAHARRGFPAAELNDLALLLEALAGQLRSPRPAVAAKAPLTLVELSSGGVPSVSQTWGDVTPTALFDWQEFDARGQEGALAAATYLSQFDPRVIDLLRSCGGLDDAEDILDVYNFLTLQP